MHRLLAMVLTALALAGGSLACSEKKEAAKPKAKKVDEKPKETTGGSSNSGSGTGSDDCSGSDLRLTQSAPTYADDVKAILDQSCISCHPGQSISLKTYDEARAAADKILARMNGNGAVMPPGGKLAQAKIDVVADWIAGGKKKDAAAGSTTGTTTGSATGSEEEEDEEGDETGGGSGSGSQGGGSPCGGTTGEEAEDEEAEDEELEDDEGLIGGDFIEQLLNPAELKQCHTSGHAFFRDKSAANPFGVCEMDVDYPAPFNCNRAGVLTAFNNNSQLTPILDDYEGKGFFYDQCGVRAGKPVVYLACFTNGGATDCAEKKCVPKESLKGDTAAICAKKISVQ